MADRNQERIARATKAKQAYLRQHIPAADYEDFGEFCEENVGNTVIESWSLEFVIQLVDQFRRKQAEKKEAEKRQPQEQKSFHIYQTGTANEMKELAEQVKQESAKQPPRSARSISKPKEESALDVLDSIFKDQKQVQFSSNKYDKAMFQSRHFWELGAAEQKQKEAQKQSPSFAKNNKPVQAAQFGTSKIEPENFEKIFQTGLKLPEIKKDTIETSPKIKKTGQDHPNGVSNKQPPKQSPKSIEAISNQQANVQNNKRNDIKLLSIKKLNSTKIPYDGEILFPQPFKQFVSCFKSFERHALSIKNLSVSITDHEIISRSFFSSDYVMYHVKVSPANIICRRNLQDFQKLRRNIESVYPGIRLPYLQKIGLFGSQTNPEIIQKQKRYLTFFLEDLMSHNQTKNFRILEDFLTLKDHKQMKRKFQEYDKLSKINAIQELCLLEGTVKVEISEPTRQYNEHIQAFSNKIKNYWGNQERIFSQIHQLHQRISSLYGELAQAITNITKEINEFNRKVTINQVQSLDDAFQSLFRYTNQHITLHEKQSQIMRNVFLVRTRYQRENMNTLDAVSATRSDLTKSYLKRREYEKQADNLEYMSERLKEFKTGITEESKNLTVLKYQCGYINNLMMTEAHHYYTLLAQKLQQAVVTATNSKREAVMKALDL